jgi:hypothetical protein
MSEKIRAIINCLGNYTNLICTYSLISTDEGGIQ